MHFMLSLYQMTVFTIVGRFHGPTGGNQRQRTGTTLFYKYKENQNQNIIPNESFNTDSWHILPLFVIKQLISSRRRCILSKFGLKKLCKTPANSSLTMCSMAVDGSLVICLSSYLYTYKIMFGNFYNE